MEFAYDLFRKKQLGTPLVAKKFFPGGGFVAGVFEDKLESFIFSLNTPFYQFFP